MQNIFLNFYSSIEQNPERRAMKTRKKYIFDKHKIKKWNRIENLESLGHLSCTSIAISEQVVFPSISSSSESSQELKCFQTTSSTSEYELTDHRNQFDENQKVPKYRIGPSRTEIDFSKHWKHQDLTDCTYKTQEKSLEGTNLAVDNRKEVFSKAEVEVGSLTLDKNNSINTMKLLERSKRRSENELNNEYSLELITLSQVPDEAMDVNKNSSTYGDSRSPSALTEKLKNMRDITENTKVELNPSGFQTDKKSETTVNLCDNVKRIKSALRTDEKKLTYENMEHDIKDMIDDLLLQSVLIKETVVGTGIQEDDTPPVLFSFYSDDHSRNFENMHWVMDEILNSVYETTNSSEFSSSSNKNENAGDANKQNNSEKHKTSKIASDLNELGATQPCNEPIFTKTQTYFCTANLNKIPKTSWTFGESQLHKTKKNSDKSEDLLMQSLDKCSNIFKLIFHEPVESSKKYVGGKSVEQLKSSNFDELSNFEKRFSSSDQIVCILKSSKKGSNIAFKNAPLLQKSTKNFDVTKSLSEPVPITQLCSHSESLEEVLHNEYLTSEDAACATSDAILRTQNQIPKTHSFRSHVSNSYVSSSSSEEIVRRRVAKKRKFSLENITKLLKPKTKRDISKMDVTTSAETTPKVGPTDTDYEGETEEVRLDFPRPKIKHRHKSEPELNTPSEIRMIEINVLQNDRLERQGCLVLGKPVLNFDSDSSFHHSNYSEATLRRQSF